MTDCRALRLVRVVVLARDPLVQMQTAHLHGSMDVRCSLCVGIKDYESGAHL